MKRALLALLLLFCLSNAAESAVVEDLHEAMKHGHVRLVSANGNGSSSGSAVEASLQNTTDVERHIDIYLSAPLFLRNSGGGQNMIGTQVLLAGGRYRSDGSKSFITLGPRRTASVSFLAFCVDFDKDNPVSSESFSVGDVPAVLMPVMSRIRQHIMANPQVDVTVAGQVAVWLAQGHAAQEIRERFAFTSADETLARNFLR
jgi:hypothetical protein